ncbi:MAG: ATP-NAD kinase, partial [Gammaproteobacteria bacterium]|nr:ATP-NAD kinase [Gammaproteobacteria bacterium]
MKIGFVINPLAGIGGAVALKGSDGDAIVKQAFSRGALPKAQSRAKLAMRELDIALTSSAQSLTFFCASGAMGEDVLRTLNL